MEKTVATQFYSTNQQFYSVNSKFIRIFAPENELELLIKQQNQYEETIFYDFADIGIDCPRGTNTALSEPATACCPACRRPAHTPDARGEGIADDGHLTRHPSSWYPTVPMVERSPAWCGAQQLCNGVSHHDGDGCLVGRRPTPPGVYSRERRGACEGPAGQAQWQYQALPESLVLDAEYQHLP